MYRVTGYNQLGFFTVFFRGLCHAAAVALRQNLLTLGARDVRVTRE